MKLTEKVNAALDAPQRLENAVKTVAALAGAAIIISLAAIIIGVLNAN